MNNTSLINKTTICFDIKVLISSPNTNLRAQLISMLKLLGCHTTEVVNGFDAIDRLATVSFDLLIADVDMQPIGGLSIAQKIRCGLPNIERKVVIWGLLDLCDPEAVKRCLAAGMNETLSHHEDVKEIKVKLAKYFNPYRQSQEPKTLNIKGQSLNNQLAANYMGTDIESALIYRTKYLLKTKPLVDELISAISSKDHDSIFHTTHKLKSSSLFIGAERLHLLCKEAESLSKDNSNFSPYALEVYQEIIQEFNHVSSIINEENNRI